MTGRAEDGRTGRTPPALGLAVVPDEPAGVEAVFEVSPTGMALLDGDERLLRANPALGALVGRAPQELVGSPLHALLAPATERAGDDPTAAAPLARVARSDGEVLLARVRRVRLPGGRTLVQVEDVSAEQRQRRELQHLATHDVLTGLPGRRPLLRHLGELLDDPERGLGRHVGVVFVDLDGFKLVNDALGHAAGDAVLVATAERLRAASREGDVVGRLGGDEFLVLSGGMSGLDAAVRLVDRLEQAVTVPVEVGQDEVFVTASFGVALCGARETTVEELLANADAAMYEAKRLGKRRYEVFDSAMRERARARTRVTALVRPPAALDRVVVHYQPVVRLPEREVVGVEALLRLRGGTGLLVPSEFLDAARDAGALPSLEARLYRIAACQVQRWREELRADLRLAVNACAEHVPELPAAVDRALAESGLPPDRLSVELTEQVMIDSGDAARDSVQALVDRGVAVLVDDFGAGWGSLTYLRRFPVSGMKIDRSFVAGLGEPSPPPRDQAVVTGLVELARGLGLQVTAEGIENPQQERALGAAGPLLGQGHLFGAAVAPRALRALLARAALARA